MYNEAVSFSQLVGQIEELLLEEWGETYSFDTRAAMETGKITLCWKKTSQPVPLDFKLSKEAYEKGNFTWRDVHRRMKNCLPENMLKQSISDANSMLRNANRRAQNEVFRDYKKWCQTTADLLDSMFGLGFSKAFNEDPILPTRLQAGSIQALQFFVEQKIDYLKTV